MAVFLFLAKEDTPSRSKDHLYDACKTFLPFFFLFICIKKSYALIDRIFFLKIEGRGSLEPDESFAE